MHKPIQIKNLCLSLPHKTCFDDFNVQIVYGSRIAIIGRNGSGKTSLLKIIHGVMDPTSGEVVMTPEVKLGYLPQLIEESNDLSGGERINKAITKAVCLNPNVLLLDEPTNHLDRHNRKSFMRMLQFYPGTLIVVSHDKELLRSCIDTLWCIDDGKISIFHGAYDDFIRKIDNTRTALAQEVLRLDQQMKEMHDSLMKEQNRAAKSKIKGQKSIQQRKWPTVVSAAKAGRAQDTSGRKKSAINNKKQELSEQLAHLRQPEIIVPKFCLSSADLNERTILSISDGRVGYSAHEPVLQKINLSIGSKDRVAVQGNNASGKSTLIKGILNHARVIKAGDWYLPKIGDIGYLDQHYNTLSPANTVLDTIAMLKPNWSHADIRRHLNDFLFRKNEEVNCYVGELSGGEKVRLSLAQLAALTPKLLILDEITNNLDLETKEHVIEVLKAYPGAMIVICHEDSFLNEIGINRYFEIKDGFVSENLISG